MPGLVYRLNQGGAIDSWRYTRYIQTDRSVFVSTMKKGQLTKENILLKAATLFNTEGYSKASLSDIMAATGLEKGGIYNHFGSKDQLMLEAFDFAVRHVGNVIRQKLDAQPDAIGKLSTLVDHFSAMAEGAPIPGGCPLMNTAIESDDSMPELRERARAAMTRFLRLVEIIIREGMEHEFRSDLDPGAEAMRLIASLEGALMLRKLYGSGAKTRPINEYWKKEFQSWKRNGL